MARKIRASERPNGASSVAIPWKRVLERALPAGVTEVSTIFLCDVLGVRASTGNARRIAKTMRSLGFFPIRSRKLLPGGWRGSEGRGWARAVRESDSRASLKQGEKLG